MKRRNFLKKSMAAGATFSLSSVPIQLMSRNMPLQRLASLSTNNRALIILQMHGGNDGLNCLIPVEQYDQYYNRRANIAIPAQGAIRSYIDLDSTLPLSQQVGFHPDMVGMKELYDSGKLAVVQGVSYKNNNGSHFRGRDISFMGGSSGDYLNSGWVGRYLEKEYEGKQYPKDFPLLDAASGGPMLDPLAIEMGNSVSLIFHRTGAVPMSYSLASNPESFAKLVNGLEGFKEEDIVDPRGLPPTDLQTSRYGQEMDYILGLERKSEDYANRLAEVFAKTSENSVVYPERYPFTAPPGAVTNRLAPQLKLISRLIEGGAKTKVFLVRIGGFDTHADQVQAFDPTKGAHAALMYHISASMNAFQRDLAARGIEDRVMTVTTSEFGRRVASNGSFGTDHGTGAPMFIFGKGVKAGVYGDSPDMSKNNVEMQHDYRQVYADIVKDWFQIEESVVTNHIFGGVDVFNGPIDGFDNFKPLDVANNGTVTSTRNDFINTRFKLKDCVPNPVAGKVTFGYYINGNTDVDLSIFDIEGRKILTLVSTSKKIGHHNVTIDLSHLKSGTYLYKLVTPYRRETKKLIKI